MKLRDRINQNIEYDPSVEMTGGLNIVRVKFPDKWRVYSNDNETIKVAQSETTANEWFYYANAESVDVDDIFDLIEHTVKFNKEMSLKIKLLNEKIDELKELFSDKDLDELKTLEFITSKPKKRKNTKKKTETKQEKELNNGLVETADISYSGV